MTSNHLPTLIIRIYVLIKIESNQTIIQAKVNQIIENRLKKKDSKSKILKFQIKTYLNNQKFIIFSFINLNF